MQPRVFVGPFDSFSGMLDPATREEREKAMTITIITTGTPRSQQQNLPCPWVVDCPPEPRR